MRIWAAPAEPTSSKMSSNSLGRFPFERLSSLHIGVAREGESLTAMLNDGWLYGLTACLIESVYYISTHQFARDRSRAKHTMEGQGISERAIKNYHNLLNGIDAVTVLQRFIQEGRTVDLGATSCAASSKFTLFLEILPFFSEQNSGRPAALNPHQKHLQMSFLELKPSTRTNFYKHFLR